MAVLPTASHITALEHTGKYFGQIDFLMFLQNLRNTFDTSFPPPFLLHSSPPPFLPFISKRNNRSRCLKWKGSDVVSETDSDFSFVLFSLEMPVDFFLGENEHLQ